MKILSRSEVQELEEHLAERPDLWVRHQGVWVRKIAGEWKKCETCDGVGETEEDSGKGYGIVYKCIECQGRKRVQQDTKEYALALKITNTLPHGMYSLSSKSVSWSDKDTQDYIDWLLSKYTSYEVRQRVLDVLRHTHRGSNFEALAAHIMSLLEEK
jgi:hypothetical protein